jgi:hypothetical protein
MSEGQYFASPGDLDDRECHKPLVDIKGRYRIVIDGSTGSGPATPSESVSTVPAQSAAVCTWQVTAGVSVLPLVPAWATGTAKKVGEPVTANSNVYRCVDGGTTAGSGTGPSGTGSSIADNDILWAYVGPAATAFAGGFAMVNIDSTSIIFYGTDAAITTTAASAPLAKDGGSIALNASPALFKVVAGASAIVGVTAMV